MSIPYSIIAKQPRVVELTTSEFSYTGQVYVSMRSEYNIEGKYLTMITVS